MLTRIPRPRRALLSSVAFVGLWAQGGPPPAAQTAPTTATAHDNDQIQEVVVTAQFRSQNLQDTPIAITAITGDMLRDRSQTDVAQVAERAPGVQLTTGGLGGSQTTTLSIRGIGQTDFDLGVEPGVGMYIDDVYYGTLYGSLLDLVDLDRVEILRGPQGTLAGKNSEGGAIKLYSKAPAPETDGYVEAILGTYNRREVRAGGNFALIPDHLFVRLTGIAEHQEGYVTDYDYQCATGKPPVPYNSPASLALQPNGVSPDGCKLGTEGGKTLVALRASVKWLITDHITDTLIYDDTIDHSDAPPLVLTSQGAWHGPGYLNPGAPANDFAQSFVPPPGSYYNYSTSCGLTGTPYQYCAEPVSNLSARGVSNTLDIDFGLGLELKAISAYRDMYQKSAADQDGSPLSWLMNTFNLDYKQYSEELRLSGPIGPKFHWTVGAYYFQYKALQGARVSLDGAVNELATFDFLEFDPVHNDSRSGFAHLECNPIDPLTLTAGVRYTKDHKSFSMEEPSRPVIPAPFWIYRYFRSTA